MIDKITKQKLNIFLLVDASRSMMGLRINQVNKAIFDIKKYLINLQYENTNIDFYITIIPFSTDSCFYKGNKSINVEQFRFDEIKCGGYSNLHTAYYKLREALNKESNGGIMPDFGGVAPIILLLTDGHPTGNAYKGELEKLKMIPWFKVALRYGIAIELNDDRTINVLSDFVGNNGEVVSCYNASFLKDIIKIIVITASKVKSTSACVVNGSHVTQNETIQQIIVEELSQSENWDW